MPAVLHNNVFDNGVNHVLNNVENLYICSQEPTTFAEASSTYKLGTKAAPAITGPTDGGAGGGRQVTVSSISDGTVDSDGTATHFALCDNSASELTVVQALASSQAVTTGNPFTLTAINVQLPDPTT